MSIELSFTNDEILISVATRVIDSDVPHTQTFNKQKSIYIIHICQLITL